MVAIFCAAFAVNGYSADEYINVIINGNGVRFSDQRPILVDGYPLVPSSPLIILLGFTDCEWYKQDETLVFSKDSKRVAFKNGSNKYAMDAPDVPEGLYEMVVAPILKENELLIPVKYLAHEYNIEYYWNAYNNTLYLIDSNYMHENTDANKNAGSSANAAASGAADPAGGATNAGSAGGDNGADPANAVNGANGANGTGPAEGAGTAGGASGAGSAGSASGADASNPAGGDNGADPANAVNGAPPERENRITVNDLPVSCAAICADLGLLIGEGHGVTSEYLEKETTRIQAAYLTLRLVGKEKEADGFEGTENFSDVGELNESARRCAAYLKAHSDLYGWQGDHEGRILPLDKITPQEFYKILLTVLGYKVGVDYQYEGTLIFADQAAGMNALRDTAANLKNAEVAVMIVEALLANVRYQSYTLAEFLASEGVIDYDRAVALGIIADTGGPKPAPQAGAREAVAPPRTGARKNATPPQPDAVNKNMPLKYSFGGKTIEINDVYGSEQIVLTEINFVDTPTVIASSTEGSMQVNLGLYGRYYYNIDVDYADIIHKAELLDSSGHLYWDERWYSDGAYYAIDLQEMLPDGQYIFHLTHMFVKPAAAGGAVAATDAANGRADPYEPPEIYGFYYKYVVFTVS